MAFGKKDKNDFYGKEVTDAIKAACDAFGVAQEALDIQVVSAGSVGIFGLIRKKAHIRAFLREEETVVVEDIDEDNDLSCDENFEPVVPIVVSKESVQIVQAETAKLLELMKFSAKVSASVEGGAINVIIQSEDEEALVAQDGKILDSIQYLIRKIVVKRVEDRIRINLDVDGFRTRRLEELKVRAVELAAQVKLDGKTQVLTSLNPSERREIHIILQEDKEIRSRSVGDGLFKKILIYKPSKGRGNGRGERHDRGERNEHSDRGERNGRSYNGRGNRGRGSRKDAE